MTDFTEVFWTFVISSVIGLAVVITKQCFKSKCDDVSVCCNLLHIHRRVDLEEEEKSDDDKKKDETPTLKNSNV
jgi:hypothetical protein